MRYAVKILIMFDTDHSCHFMIFSLRFFGPIVFTSYSRDPYPVRYTGCIDFNNTHYHMTKTWRTTEQTHIEVLYDSLSIYLVTVCDGTFHADTLSL